MTIKEAILKSLEEINNYATYLDVYSHILNHSYYDFGTAKTPSSTVSASLGDFIRSGDARVKRIKRENGNYYYYLTKNELSINQDLIGEVSVQENEKNHKYIKTKTYEERALHKLLNTYLKHSDIFAKTIFHEQSNVKDNNQIWTHPDMVGVKFLNLQTKASQNFLKSINRVDTFKITSYELKKEINSDSDLKKAYFQAVSNSSWANYGYLVAYDVSDSLIEEMGRLNQSFGIGIIELNPNPYQSKVLFQSVYRNLDFTTIDKLCKINNEFEKFIELIEKLLTASEKYVTGAEKELEEFCDEYFDNETEIENYCREKNIPLNKE